jgi:hypothetical protein
VGRLYPANHHFTQSVKVDALSDELQLLELNGTSGS